MHLAQKIRFHELRPPAGQPAPKKEILLPLGHLGLEHHEMHMKTPLQPAGGHPRCTLGARAAAASVGVVLVGLEHPTGHPRGAR